MAETKYFCSDSVSQTKTVMIRRVVKTFEKHEFLVCSLFLSHMWFLTVPFLDFTTDIMSVFIFSWNNSNKKNLNLES